MGGNLALVVDDSKINLLVVDEALRGFGIESISAMSGQEAVKLAGKHRFAIIFMDHMMPEMDGLEATRRIRALGGHNKEVPIIALTANSAQEHAKEYLQVGMNGWLNKPFDIDALEDTLRAWIPKYSPGEGGAQKVRVVSERLQTIAETCCLDIQDALAQMAGEEAYLRVLKTFANTAGKHIAAFRKAAEKNDLHRVRIEAHALKSSLHHIGAVTLSEQAYRLERAAIEQDAGRVAAEAQEFSVGVTALHERLDEFFPEGWNRDARNATAEERAKLPLWAEQIIEDLEVLESDGAIWRLKDLGRLHFDDGVDGLLREALQDIENFDYDGATHALKKCIKLMENLR